MVPAFIIKALSFVGGNDMFKYISIGIAVLIIGGSFYYLNSEIDQKDQTIIEQTKTIQTEKENVKSLVNSNHEMAKSFETYIVDQAKAMIVLKDQHKQTVMDLKKISKIKGEINHVNKKDDGVAAAVLVNTFSRLQQFQQTTTNKSDHKDQSEKTINTR